MVDYPQIISKGIALGISTGGYCSLYCLPVLAPILLAQESGVGDAARALLRFLSGRLAAYLLVGVLAGWLGDWVMGLPWLMPGAFIILGAWMLLHASTNRLTHRGLCGRFGAHTHKPGFLFFLGFLVGLNLCPPFLLAIGVATDAASVTKSVLFFFIFFIATSLFLLPLLFVGFARRALLLRRVARALTAIVGAYFLLQGALRIAVLA